MPHRVIIDAQLVPTERGGLKVELRAGNRSLLFVFPAPDSNDPPVRLGAVVERIAGGRPGEQFTAELLFWDEVAEIYASEGAEFDIWYSRHVGHGRVSRAEPTG